MTKLKTSLMVSVVVWAVLSLIGLVVLPQETVVYYLGCVGIGSVVSFIFINL